MLTPTRLMASMFVVLVIAGCSGDPKPIPQQVAPSANATPDAAEVSDAKAAADRLARLDALIADTNRKEAEYKEAERATAEQTEKLARERAVATSQSQEITAPEGTPLGDRQRLRAAAAKAGLAWNFIDETHSATVGDVFRAMSLSKKIEFIRQMKELAFESRTEQDQFVNLYDEQGTLVASDSFRYGLNIK
jgi:hypothetical protein